MDTERSVYVMVEGLDSQIGMALLDLWAMLGEDEARATLQRPMWVLPEPLLHEVEEVATRRTHATAAKRDSPTPTERLKADSPEKVTEVLQMALARYEQNPALAVDILAEAFGEGLPQDPDLASAVCSTWGLCLRNAGRIEEALDRFDQGLQLARDPVARQDLHYNRGYARLMTLMSEQQSLGGEQLRSAFRVQASDKLTLALCHADFTEALRLDPEDPHAESQLQICEQLIAAITPPDG